MRIDEDGEISFQDGGFVFGGTYTGDYTPGPTGTPSDRPPGSAGPNDPNFNWNLYNSLLRDPYMGGYTGFGPDLTAALEGSLNPTGIMLDQDAISKAIADYQASLAPATPVTTAPVTTPPATTPPADDAGVLDLLRTGATRVGEVIDRGLMAVGDFFRNAPQLVVLNPVNPSATVVFGTPSGTTTPTIIGSMPTSGAPIGVATGNPLIDAILSKVFSKRAPGQSGPDWATVVKEAVLEEIGNQTGYDIGSVVGAAQGGLDADVQRVIDSATKVVLGVNEEVDKFDKNNPTLDTIGAEKIPGDVTTTDTEEIFGVPGTAGETSVETDTNQLIDLIGGPGPDMGPIRTTTTTTPATGTDTDDLINLIGGPGPDMGPIKTTATDTTKKKVDDTTVTDDTTKKKVDDTTVTDDTTKKKVDDTTVTDDTTKKKVDDTTVVEEDDTKKVVSPDGPVTPPKVVSPGSLNIPGVVTPTTPAPQQGVRMERTKKAGLAEIDPQFELNASLLDNLLRILSSEDDNSAGVPYYRGGKVAPYADIDEIIRLLRG
jgi:hypothetical protein